MIETIEQFNRFLEIRDNIGIKPGTYRMKQLLKACGQPQDKLKAIHVAGTNGKGSTVEFLAQVLQSAGYQVGTFTSPSLSRRNEMIQINGVAIEDGKLVQYFNIIYEQIRQLDKEGHAPSSFEIIVAIAYQFFFEYTDVAIIEAGMGGREDATNVLAPLLTIITSIGTDHRSFLGETLQEIAFHKAGIIKAKTPIIIGKIPAETIPIIQREAKEKQAPIYQLDLDFSCKTRQNDQIFFTDKQGNTLDFSLSMQGRHQIQNASLAVKAILLLQSHSLFVSKQTLITSLKMTTLAGRFEQIAADPVIIIDGAHNVEGMQAFIDEVMCNYKEQQKQLIFAVFRDKPVKEMIRLVDPIFDTIIFTQFTHPRAMKAVDLYHYSRNVNKQYRTDWQALMRSLHERSQPTFVAGSLDFIGKVRGSYLEML